MAWSPRSWMGLAALSGLTSVAIGAFAAHGVKDPQTQSLLRTGSTYQAIHSLASLVTPLFLQMGARRARHAPGFFLAGVLLFSGSLYALALGAPRWIGAVTPLGGLAFMLGWGVLAWAAWELKDSPS
jgi:uncharacterized membrane protein YgdD (TMEM256/DUF423 family)